jgi:hypothetical protein
MKKTIVYFLTFAALFYPVLSFGATEIESLNALTGSHDLLSLKGGACLRFEQQCKEDPFDAGKIECTQRCTEYERTDSGNNDNSSAGSFEMDPLKAILGLVIVGALLYWALTSAG